MVWSNSDRAGYFRAPLSGPELMDLREQATLYEGFAAIDLLGVAPALGRGFLPEEAGPGALLPASAPGCSAAAGWTWATAPARCRS
jgi:hypothetical protein